jgi:hypothetical protein
MENRADFVSLEEAVRDFGTTRPALTRRIDAGELTVYSSGMDRRLKLIAKEDLAELMKIKPVSSPVRIAVR